MANWYVDGMLSDEQTEAVEEDYKQHLKLQGEISRTFLQRNAFINQLFRLMLLIASLIFLSGLIYYVFVHADAMARVLLDRNESAGEFWQAAGAVLIPVGVLLLFVTGMIILALHIQTRGVTEFERLMDGVSRIRRDAVGVSRTRSVSFVVEESLAKAKHSFALQLWLGRTLFVASLALLAGFIVYSTLEGKIDALSVTLAAGSVLSFLVSSVTGAADKVGNSLGDVTQIQLIVMTTAERLSLLSEYAYVLLEDRSRPEIARNEMPGIMDRLKAIADDAAQQIQQYAEPRGLPPGTS